MGVFVKEAEGEEGTHEEIKTKEDGEECPRSQAFAFVLWLMN